MKSYLEEDEVQRLEEAAAYLRDRLLIRPLFRLGCRVSEALALDVKDVDLTNATITILHLKARLRLLCPTCEARLGTTHAFCPGRGASSDAQDPPASRHALAETLSRTHGECPTLMA